MTQTSIVFALDPLPVTSSPAYLLISHGSRDSRSQSAVARLAQLVRERLRQTLGGCQPFPDADPRNTPTGFVQPSDSGHLWSVYSRSTSLLLTSPQRPAPSMAKSMLEQSLMPIVGTACLELGPCPLHQQIYQFSQRVKAAGINRVRVLPLFLFEGVHVMEDIPMEMALARQILDASLEVTLRPHLGSHLGLRRLLTDRLAQIPSAACLLIAHGSRRPGGNKPIEEIARQLGAIAAYWSVPPDLETQIIYLMQKGHQQLAILPYFLFPGGITDAITQFTEELAERFPRVNFRLLPPLGATPELANVVVDLAREEGS